MRLSSLGVVLGLLLTSVIYSSAWLIVSPVASAQSYVSIYETKIVCPTCARLGVSSKSALGGIDGQSFKYLSEFEKDYWDESGNYHGHDLSCSYMHCSNGHLFRHYDGKCWCGWPFATDVPNN